VRLHRTWNKNTNPTDFAGLLPAHRNRPRDRSATKQRDEISSLHEAPKPDDASLPYRMEIVVHYSKSGRSMSA
jgi:hypothetical protein